MIIRLGAVLAALGLIVLLDFNLPDVQLAPIAAVPLVIFAAAAPRWLALTVALLSAIIFSFVDSDAPSLVRNIHSMVPFDALTLAVGFVTLVLVTDVLRHQSAAKATLEATLERTKAEEERSRFLAQHDFLSGLPNRVVFEDRLTQAMNHARRIASSVGLVLIDVDDLKKLNDTYGHQAGDLAIKEIARHLLQQMRAEDTVARIGGDEFGIVLSHPQNALDVEIVGRKIAASFPISVAVGAEAFKLTAGVGHSVFPDDGANLAELVNAADAAMYRSKHQRA